MLPTRNKKNFEHICIFAGEKSADLYASHLIRVLKNTVDHQISGMGGNLMRSAGCNILWDIRDHSVMGFSEVIQKLPSLLTLLSQIKSYILEKRPSLVICIDNWGLNSRIARFCKAHNIKVAYFICPKFWIWNHSRAETISHIADIVFPIFDFECVELKKYGCNISFFGHPLKHIIDTELEKNSFDVKRELNIPQKHILITIMPGSRKMEVRSLIPTFCKICSYMKKRMNVSFVVIKSDSVSHMKAFDILSSIADLHIISDTYRYSIMSSSDLILAASGTVVLESMLLNIPTAVFYKVNIFSYIIAKYFLKIKYVSLPNIIAQKYIIPEFIQKFNCKKISENLLKLCENTNRKNKMKKQLNYYSQPLSQHNVIEQITEKMKEML